MELESLSNKELAYLYLEYKQKRNMLKEKENKSFYEFNRYLEIKTHLSSIKWEMKKRGLKKKEAKKLSNY